MSIQDIVFLKAYDCLIIFYDQDNEEIDGVLKLGEFETGLENFTNNDNMDVEISIAEKE